MSEAILQDVTGGIDVTWPDNPFIIHVRRLHTHTDGRVTGEIMIVVKDKKKDKIVHSNSQINFAADRTRSGLAKELSTKNPNFPWGDMIDQVCQLVPEKVREGEPVQEMWAGLEDEQISPPKYLLDPFILENLPNVIFGDPGTLKSTLGLAFAGIMVLNQHENGMNLIPNGRDIRTLYLDWEVDYNTLKWQLARLQKGMNLPPVMISYRHCYLPLAKDVEQIQQHIEKSKANLIIIDSLGPACGGELKDAQPALEFFQALRKLNISSLSLGHTNRDKEAKAKGIYGSVFFEAQARNIWEVRKVQEAGEDELDLAFFHTKPPPFAQKHKPMGYCFHFEPDKAWIESRDPKSVPEFMERMGNNTRILNLLKDGALEPKEIADTLSINPNSVRTSLKRLAGKSLVVKVGEKYGLQSNF